MGSTTTYKKQWRRLRWPMAVSQPSREMKMIEIQKAPTASEGVKLASRQERSTTCLQI
jgi:hypothetical protein